MNRHPPRLTLFPHPTLSRSAPVAAHTYPPRSSTRTVGRPARRRPTTIGCRSRGPAWSRARLEPARQLSSASPAYSSRTTGERSEEHTSELQSRQYLVCRLLL